MADGQTYGINFPFRDSPVGDYLSLSVTTEEEIRSNLLHLLLTRRGSRYYLPTFGTRLYEFIFEPLDAQTFNSMKDEIYEQVRTYIPNLTITNITIEPYTEAEAPIGDVDVELLGQADIYRLPGANTADYTAKIKIEYIDEASAFGGRNFVIINI